MEIGDKVRYIGGQDRQARRIFRLYKDKFYTVVRMHPEHYPELGLCQSIGIKEHRGMFRMDLFVVIPVMKEQNIMKHQNYIGDGTR